jgi:hypothetical protein
MIVVLVPVSSVTEGIERQLYPYRYSNREDAVFRSVPRHGDSSFFLFYLRIGEGSLRSVTDVFKASFTSSNMKLLHTCKIN